MYKMLRNVKVRQKIKKRSLKTKILLLHARVNRH